MKIILINSKLIIKKNLKANVNSKEIKSNNLIIQILNKKIIKRVYKLVILIFQLL
jgi:hypothetical protein